MTEIQTYAAIVVGGGAVGLSAARELGRRGIHTLVLEAGPLFHDHASSAGTERHSRVQYSQEDLSRLALETAAEWDRLESESGRRLRHRVGSLWFGDVDVDTNEGQITSAARVMDKLDIPYEWLTAREITDRFGFRDLPADYAGFLQPDGGIVDVKATLLALYELSIRSGVHVTPNAPVRSIEPETDTVRVVTDSGTYRTSSLVVAAGPATARLLRPFGVDMDYRVFEMANLSFVPSNGRVELPFWFAFQQPTERDTNLFYGFGPRPWATDSACRVAPMFEIDEITAETVPTLRPKAYDVDRVHDWVRTHMPMLEARAVSATTCLAVLPRDPARQFYFGPVTAPGAGTARIATFAAGWGFKFVPILGRVLADWACTGKTDIDVQRLSVS